MENLIKELIKLDEKAGEITKNVETDLRRLEETIKEKKKQAEDEINTDTEAKLMEIEAELKRKMGAKKMESDRFFQQRLKALSFHYKDNKEEWVRSIFNSVARL